MRVRVRVRVRDEVEGEGEGEGVSESESESAVIDVENNGRIPPSCCREGWGQQHTIEPLTSPAVFEVNDELETATVEEEMRIAPPCQWVVRDG